MENTMRNSLPTPPPWVDKEFVQKALRKGERNSEMTVRDIKVAFASRGAGEYTSSIFRIEASIQTGTTTNPKSAVIKVAHETGELEDLITEISVFHTESLVLHDVMTRLNDLLRSVEGDLFLPLAAKCYDHGNQPTDFIVLEDLMASGFRLADAGKPLDLNHCQMAMRSYGRLHGASACLLRQQPRYRDLFAKDPFMEDISGRLFKLWTRDMFHSAVEEMKKCTVCKKYATKYKKISGKALGMVVAAMADKQKKTSLTVLTHGDCWKNNMMFRYSHETPLEIRFLDFQATSANSPVRDLVYFLYANASEDVHLLHLDRLLADYHSALVGTLRALGLADAADEYPLQQLKKDMDDYLVVGMLFTMMSGFVLKTSDSSIRGGDGLNGFGHNGSMTDGSHSSAHAMLSLKYLSPIFEAKGLL